MTKLLESHEDIAELVNAFYAVSRQDPELAYLFNTIPDHRWPKHVDKIVRFWATILIDEQSYQGNPMLKHLVLNQQYPLTERHFDVWFQHWTNTVRSLFHGEKAEEAIFRASTIKTMMFKRISGQIIG